MTYLQRIAKIFADSKEKGQNQPLNTFEYDMHTLAQTKYSHLGKWEKIARSMAGAMVNQKIYIEKYDKIIGRIYHLNGKPVENGDIDFNYLSRPHKKICEMISGYEELKEHQLVGGTGKGHITWAWDNILRLGTSGMRMQYQKALEKAPDEKSRQFYSGVLIMLDALDDWNELHVAELERMGMQDMAKLCRKVPKQPAETFHEAVQSFYAIYRSYA